MANQMTILQQWIMIIIIDYDNFDFDHTTHYDKNTLLWLWDDLILTHILLVFVTHRMTIMTKNMIAAATLNKYDHEMGMMKTWSKSWQSQPDEEHDGTSNVEPGEVDEVGDEPAGGGVGGPDGSYYLEIGRAKTNFGQYHQLPHWFSGAKNKFFLVPKNDPGQKEEEKSGWKIRAEKENQSAEK